MSQFYADNMGKRYAKHGALEATAEFSSTGMRAHADACAIAYSVMKAALHWLSVSGEFEYQPSRRVVSQLGHYLTPVALPAR